MEHMHPHLRLAAGLILAAGLASACSGGGSGTAAMTPAPTPDPEPTPTVTTTDLDGEPSDCTAASDNCIITTVTGGTTTVRTIRTTTDTMAMTSTRTDTDGSMRTITVRSTVEAHASRVISTETCTVSGDSCTRTSLVERTYTAAGGNTAASTITRTYTMGRETRRVTVMGDTTTTVGIRYSSSNGGRTESTVTSTGTRVQTFSQFSGGTAASTVFTSTDGLTVTTANAAGMRVETVYANAADARAGQNPRSMTVGTAAADADSGFRSGTTKTVTTYVASPVALAGQTLVEWTATVAIDADGDEGDPVITSRTYITARDDMGRETTRQTRAVANGLDGAATGTVTTSYPEAGGMTVTTIVTGTSWTQVETDAMGTVTTTVRATDSPSSDPVTIMTANPAASDGSRTVDTVFGAGHPSRAADGQRDRVKTNADGTTVTTLFTGAGVAVTDEASWTTVSVTTRDENGVETMLVAFSGNTRTTTTTAYMTAGSSTVTTVTATRADADSMYGDTRRVVVTRDAAQRETRRVAADIDSDGDESNQQTTVTVYAADGSSTATRTFSGGMGDLLTDNEIVKRNAAGAITDDIVVHPGVQDHTMVSDAQYQMIQTGMAARPGARTVMARPILHVNYSEDDAFNGLVNNPPAGGVNVEAEFIARSPTCAANGNCTFQGLRWYVEQFRAPEIRVYDPANPNTRLFASGQAGTRTQYGGYSRNNVVGGFGWHQRRESENALLKLLAELLTVGGAGASATSTASTLGTADMETVESDRSYGGTVTIKPEAMTALEGRETFTHLETVGLARGVLGIGQQVKEVDSYMRLTERQADGSRPDDAVETKVENYFGWMEHSMFTVRRVTATNVAGSDFDWVNGSPAPDATDQVRAYVGMASGTPSDRPTERRATGMADPGTWTGEMIGVGTVQGERYRGAAKVTVDFDDNSVTTAFSGIRLALGGIDLATRDAMVRHVSDMLTDGISFTSSGIASNGSFTGRIADADRLPATGIRQGLEMAERADEITGRFYGSGANAEEVAGTFNAIGLALGRTGEEAMDDTRGDLVGAFGATRDPMTEVESN